jgi:DNA polymerase-3 subunit alpha
MLAKHREGLIILSGCMNGPVSFEIMQKNFSGDKFKGAVEYIKKFKSIFGDDYYIELQMPGVDGDKLLFRKLVALADHFKVKVILSNDCHYVSRRDFELQRVMMAVDQNTTIDDPNMFIVNSDEQYLKTRAELRATFHCRGFAEDVPLSVFEDACNNTLEVADKCESFKPNVEPKLPKIENDKKELCRLALKSLKEKSLLNNKKKFIMDGREVTYREQVEIELKRIIEKGFASYFLITRELVMESRRNGWPLGPARGSAGGSLLCYLLGITTIDPLLWSGVSFNRFLSPARGGNMLRITMEG